MAHGDVCGMVVDRGVLLLVSVEPRLLLRLRRSSLDRIVAGRGCRRRRGPSGIEHGLEQVSGESVEDVAVFHCSGPFLAKDRQALRAVSCGFEGVVGEE